MTWLRVLVSRVMGWVRRDRLDEDFDEEVHFHLEMETAANVDRGLSPDEARRVARERQRRQRPNASIAHRSA